MAQGTTRRVPLGLLLALLAVASVGLAGAEQPRAEPARAAAKGSFSFPTCDQYAGDEPARTTLPDQNFARHPRCMA